MNFSSLKILYIEDNLGDRVILEEYLSVSLINGVLECCDTLMEGINLIKKKEFDLILLDLSLPDSHGVESVRLLNEQINSSIPIIVFTGLDNNDVAIRALKFGAQDFLVKGDFNFSLINKTIKYAIERHKVKHELVIKSKELSISKNMLSRAESLADIGSWHVDFKSKQVKLSNGMKKLLGLDSNSDLISFNKFLSFIHKEDKKSMLRTLVNTNILQSTDALEPRFVRKNGEEFYSSCKVEILSTSDNDYLVYGVTLDVSRQKEVENDKAAFTLNLSNKVKERTLELEETKHKLEDSLLKEKELGELKTRFVSTASHQFRTPLTVILSNVGLLELQSKNIDSTLIPHFGKVTQRIKSEVKRMTEIIDEVLILGKINSDGIQPVFRSVDIVEICTNIVDKYNDIQEDGRRAVMKVKGENRMVEMDQNLFEDAISNMLSNAFKYSLGKPAPEVTLIYGSEILELQVKDFGLGIPEQDLKNLFDPFFRASNVLDIPGNGLGTSIMKEFFEINKGKIEVKSVVNKGTTFNVQFKLRKNG